MSNDKLAEALRDAEATVLAFLGDVAFDGSVCGIKRATVKGMFARLQAHAAEAAQAQSGDWVVVPREPTEWMLQAAEDAVNAAAHCESTTDDLSAIAYKAALAAAPQPQAAEPVRQFRVVPKGSVWTDVKDPEIWASVTAHPESYETRVLYTHPQPAQDAKDAARLDWLEAHPRLASIVIDGSATDCYLYGISGAPGLKLREILDAAMVKASGR